MGQGGDGDVPMLDQHFAYQSGVRNMALAKRCDGHGDGGGDRRIRDHGDGGDDGEDLRYALPDRHCS